MACKHENWHYGMNSVKYCLACDQPIIGTLGDTSLSLLVIDLGDSCVVKVEQGELHGLEQYFPDTVMGSCLSNQPFAAVRDAIDSQDKPVPRIELSSDIGVGLQTYRLYLRDDEMLVCPERSFVMDSKDLVALGNYVGKPLPIWSGGTWEMLNGEMPKDSLPCKIWRYTR